MVLIAPFYTVYRAIKYKKFTQKVTWYMTGERLEAHKADTRRVKALFEDLKLTLAALLYYPMF